MFDKWWLFDLSWKAQPLYLLSKALQPFGVQERYGSFLGTFAFQCAPCHPVVWQKEPSWVPLVTGKHFLSPSPWDFLVITQPMQIQAGYNTPLYRCPDWLSAKVPIAMFYRFTTCFGKDHLCKNIFFFLLGSKHVTKAITLKKSGTNYHSPVCWFAIHILPLWTGSMSLVRLLWI